MVNVIGLCGEDWRKNGTYKNSEWAKSDKSRVLIQCESKINKIMDGNRHLRDFVERQDFKVRR